MLFDIKFKRNKIQILNRYQVSWIFYFFLKSASFVVLRFLLEVLISLERFENDTIFLRGSSKNIRLKTFLNCRVDVVEKKFNSQWYISIACKVFELLFRLLFRFLYMPPLHRCRIWKKVISTRRWYLFLWFFLRKCIYIYQRGGMYFGPWRLQPPRDGDALLTLNWWTKAATIGLRCPELFLERHPGGRCISRRWCVSCVFVYLFHRAFSFIEHDAS